MTSEAETTASEAAASEPGTLDDAIARDRALRICEAVLFAASEPLAEKHLQQHLGPRFPARDLLLDLQDRYSGRGFQLEQHGELWAFRTNPDFAEHLVREEVRRRPPSKAALETLAIIAYRQPITRAEIEEIRGIAVASGTLDILLDAGWIKPAGRRDTPGKPVLWRTTSAFLDHFDLASLDDLPRLDELDGAGLLTQMATPNT